MRKSLNIVAALGCEAAPLIEFYKLIKTLDKPFAFYHSAIDFDINLVVAGIGELNMATAVGWLAARSAERDCVWLNFGTAGHASEALGEYGLIHKVQRDLEERAHYPPLVAEWRGKSFALTSCKAACTDYPANLAVDMEAAAFFKSALKFTSSERIQAIKVISDNPGSGIDQLNASKISALMRPAVADVNHFAQALLNLLPGHQVHSQLTNKLAGLHYTVAQGRQFNDLLEKARALSISDQQIENLIEPNPAGRQSMAQVLNRMRAALTSSSPHLS